MSMATLVISVVHWSLPRRSSWPLNESRFAYSVGFHSGWPWEIVIPAAKVSLNRNTPVLGRELVPPNTWNFAAEASLGAGFLTAPSWAVEGRAMQSAHAVDRMDRRMTQSPSGRMEWKQAGNGPESVWPGHSYAMDATTRSRNWGKGIAARLPRTRRAAVMARVRDRV